MQVTFDIPDDLASQLLAASKNPSRAALEAFAVEGYRSECRTESEVHRTLDYEIRMDVQNPLAGHSLWLHCTAEHLQQDIAASDILYTAHKL